MWHNSQAFNPFLKSWCIIAYISISPIFPDCMSFQVWLVRLSFTYWLDANIVLNRIITFHSMVGYRAKHEGKVLDDASGSTISILETLTWRDKVLGKLLPTKWLWHKAALPDGTLGEIKHEIWYSVFSVLLLIQTQLQTPMIHGGLLHCSGYVFPWHGFPLRKS